MSYAQPRQRVANRFIGFAFVVLFHLALGYALVTGLARRMVEVVRPPLETKIIEEVKPPPQEKPPPPPPPPRMAAPPPPYIPPPEVQVQLPPTVQQNVITAVTTVKPAEPIATPGQPPAPPQPSPVQVRTPVRTPAVVVARACEKPDYPSASLRANESGVVLLAFLVDINGRVLESKVERSTGYRRLDEAARKGLGLCKFKPATLDGKPERAWAKIEYEWKIE